MFAQALNAGVQSNCGDNRISRVHASTMFTWLSHVTIGVIALLRGDFPNALDVLRRACKDHNCNDSLLPCWLSYEAIAGLAWVNYASAIIGDGTARDQLEVVSILDFSLKKLPCHALLHHHLADCLLFERKFPQAMCALHCALSF